MKKFIFLFLIVSLSFCADYSYENPPLDSVNSQNGIIADGLSDSFNGTHAKNTSIYVQWYGRSLGFNSSMRIAGLTLLIDNSTIAGENVRVVIEKGGVMSHILKKYSSGICDKAYFDSHGDDSNCDFDGDGCAEYEYSSDIFYTIEITFVFRGVNETVRIPEESIGVFGKTFDNALTNTVSIPDSIEELMANSSGGENLTIFLNGTATAVYGMDNRTSAGGCISRFGTLSETLYFEGNATYPVDGRHKLIFTVAPVMNEQWYKNNKFDNIVLSQSRIYKASVLMNGELEEEFTLYGFNITENPSGLQEIISIENESSAFMGMFDVNPNVLDEGNQSYAYVYQFNYSYEGLGENELRLNIKDIYGNELNKTEVILSRQISYSGNKTETGSEYEFETTRKSAVFETDSLTLIRVGLGMLGVFVIVFLAFQARR